VPELEQPVEALRSRARDCGFVELGRSLHTNHPAAELRREQQSRPAAPRGDVEYASARTETKPLPQQADLLGAGRILKLVVALGYGVIPGH
jgi:hypothetical protein